MTRAEWEAEKMARYSRSLESGTCTIEEVTGGIMRTLAESADPAALWAVAPASLRSKVRDHVAAIGPDGWEAAPFIGNDTPEARAVRTAQQRPLAARLLKDFA